MFLCWFDSGTGCSGAGFGWWGLFWVFLLSSCSYLLVGVGGGVVCVGFGGFWVMVLSGVSVGWPWRVACRSWWIVRVASATRTV